MPLLLFKLRGVPDDEADEVRALLRDQHIDFYETSAGNWGISMPGIWVKDTDQLVRGKALIADYQQARARRARADYAQSLREGRQRTVVDVIKESPLRFALYLTLILLIVYLSLWPFMGL